MTLTETELVERWHQTQHMPDGPARFGAIDLVLRHADAAGFDKLAFGWRMAAINTFHHGGDPARVFLAFSQNLAAFDRDPALGNRNTASQLLWQFKWVVWALPQFPEIPLARTRAILDDMQARFLRGGYSLHAVYQHRWLVAHHTGDPMAQEWYDRMVTAPRDSLSDCQACVPSSQVRHLVTLGRDEEAIEIGTPYSNGGCTEQPQWMLSELLLPYLRTARFDQAADAHRSGYRRMRTDRHHLDNIAQHLYFCGVSGNEARGLEIVERHRGWLTAPSSPYAAMEFAAAAALVLRRLTESGHGDLPIRITDNATAISTGTAPGAISSGNVSAGAAGAVSAGTVSAAAAAMAGLAREIAVRFDERNGNTHQSTRIESRMAAAQLVPRLPLTVVAGLRDGVPEQAAVQLELAAGYTAHGDQSRAAGALLAAAYELHRLQRHAETVEAAEEATRAFERLHDTENMLRAKALLWEVYRGRHDQAEAIAVLPGLLAAAEPWDRGVLCEQAAATYGWGREAVRWHTGAADAYRDAGDRMGELRALVNAIRTGGPDDLIPRAQHLAAGPVPTLDTPTPAATASVLLPVSAAADRTVNSVAGASPRTALTPGTAEPTPGATGSTRASAPGAAGPVTFLGPAASAALAGLLPTDPAEVWPVHVAELEVQISKRQFRAGDHRAAAGSALAAADRTKDRGCRTELRLTAARALLALDEPEEAEIVARDALADNGIYPDDAAMLLVLALQRQGRNEEADAVISEYDIDVYSLEYALEDD